MGSMKAQKNRVRKCSPMTCLSVSDRVVERFCTICRRRVNSSGETVDSGLVMYPAGHARNTTADLDGILAQKYEMLGSIATGTEEATDGLVSRLNSIDSMDAFEMASLYDFEICLSDEEYE